MFAISAILIGVVGVFFAAFMLYYFSNWKLLSFLWRIG